MDLLDVQIIAYLLQDVVTEFLPLVRHQLPRKSVVSEIVIIQTFGNGHCSLVLNFVGLHMV